MATAQKSRDLIAQTTTGTARPRVPREVREEVCRYAGRRRREGAAWALIARETGLEPRELQRWGGRARLAAPRWRPALGPLHHSSRWLRSAFPFAAPGPRRAGSGLGPEAPPVFRSTRFMNSSSAGWRSRCSRVLGMLSAAIERSMA